MKKNSRKKTDDLEDLVNEMSLVETRGREKGVVNSDEHNFKISVARKRLAFMGIYKPVKYTEEACIDFYTELYSYVLSNVGVTQLSAYYADPTTENVLVPQHKLGDYAKKWKVCGAIYKELRAMIQHRLIDGGLNDYYNAGFTKFVLSANYGMSETSNQNVNVTQRNVVFNFNNDELKAEEDPDDDDDIEDTDYEDITDETQED